jgi:putative transposase
MRKAGLRGVQPASRCAPQSDPAAATPPDLVDRQFKAAAPNRLWVAESPS